MNIRIITLLLTFNLGNITLNGTDGLHNGVISSIIFNANVININTNQNGTQIHNNVTFNFTMLKEQIKH